METHPSRHTVKSRANVHPTTSKNKEMRKLQGWVPKLLKSDAFDTPAVRTYTYRLISTFVITEPVEGASLLLFNPQNLKIFEFMNQ